jgi:hypothetical protein
MQNTDFFVFFTNILKNKKAASLKLSPIDLKLNFECHFKGRKKILFARKPMGLFPKKIFCSLNKPMGLFLKF